MNAWMIGIGIGFGIGIGVRIGIGNGNGSGNKMNAWWHARRGHVILCPARFWRFRCVPTFLLGLPWCSLVCRICGCFSRSRFGCVWLPPYVLSSLTYVNKRLTDMQGCVDFNLDIPFETALDKLPTPLKFWISCSKHPLWTTWIPTWQLNRSSLVLVSHRADDSNTAWFTASRALRWGSRTA